MMIRLLEEAGELAQMVNHFEGQGSNAKIWHTRLAKLAKEVMDLLRCGLQIAMYYGIEDDPKNKINDSYEKTKNEGLIRD